MNTLFDRLRRLFSGKPQHAGKQDTAPDSFAADAPDSDTAEPRSVESTVILDDGSMPRLMSLIERTKEGEYVCEETLDLLDEYAELVAGGQDAASIMPLVKGHLEHCVDCTERYEALLNILEG